jgi:uncharacterized protein (TIGR03067 family)
MIRQVLIAAMCVAAIGQICDGQTPDERAKLTGKWTCSSAVIDGRPLAEEGAKALQLTLTTDRYKTERGNQVLFDSTYSIDATKNPQTIDMVGTEGEAKGKPARGIYKLDGDQLTICYVMPGKDRPASFESKPDSGAYLVVWKRSK